MTPLEHLRLAASLGHAVHGAELRLHSAAGNIVIVSAHPAADIGHCALRQVVVAAACPTNTDISGHVDEITFGGSLDDVGAGIYRVVRSGHEQRWIPSLLHPRRLASLLDPVRLDGVADDALHATLKPDVQLGVTLVVLTTTERHVDRLDEVAERTAATIAVEELHAAASREFALTRADADSGDARYHM